MTRHLHIVKMVEVSDCVPTARVITPWDDPESCRADNIADIEHYERVARAIAAKQHRATRLSARAVFHRLGHSASVAIARLIDGDLFFLITGAMVALDLVLVIVLARS